MLDLKALVGVSEGVTAHREPWPLRRICLQDFHEFSGNLGNAGRGGGGRKLDHRKASIYTRQ